MVLIPIKRKIQGHTVNFFAIRRPERLTGRVHNILTAIFTLKLKSMTCWNDCSVQEGYSKQTLMTLINGVNEALTGRVSFCRQCSTGIMANVSGDNYIYYTLSYGILAGVWGARQLERRVKALGRFETEECRRVFVRVRACVRAWVHACAHSRVCGDGRKGGVCVNNSKTIAPNSGWTRCLHAERDTQKSIIHIFNLSPFKHFVPGNNDVRSHRAPSVSAGAEWRPEIQITQTRCSLTEQMWYKLGEWLTTNMCVWCIVVCLPCRRPNDKRRALNSR